jgi:hypothetical protein
MVCTQYRSKVYNKRIRYKLVWRLSDRNYMAGEILERDGAWHPYLSERAVTERTGGYQRLNSLLQLLFSLAE